MAIALTAASSSRLSIFNSGGLSALSPSLPAAYPYTIFCWFRPKAAQMSAAGYLGGLGDGGGGDGLEIALAGADPGDPVIASPRAGGTAIFDAAAGPMLQDTWLPCMVVWLSSASRTVYLHTYSPVTGTGASAPSLAGLKEFVIGRRPSSGLNHCTADVGEVAVWRTALTSTDWDTLRSGAKPNTVQTANLWDYWELLTQAATHTGVNGIVLTATNTTQAADHPLSTATLSGTATLSAVTASGGFLSVASSLTGNATLGPVIASGSLGLAPGVALVPELRNWGGLLQAGVTIPVVTVCRLDTGAQVLTLTNQVTNGSGNLSITNAALATGTAYMVIGWNADGSQRFAAPVVAG